MRRIPLHLYFLSLVSAGLQILPFPVAGPVPGWRRIFCWICLVPFLLALSGKQRSGKSLQFTQSAFLGYICGIAWYLGNCYWIYQTMHLYGDLSEAASAGILVLFALYLGLYLGLFGLLFAVIRKTWGVTVALVTSPLLWVTIELARDRVTGFPWDLLGYSQIDNLTLIRMAPWTGVFGLSLVIAAVNMLWAFAAAKLRPRIRSAALVAACVFSAVAVWLQFSGPVPQPSPTAAIAVLVQENLAVGAGTGQHLEAKAVMLSSFAALSRHPDFPLKSGAASSPQLIAWPESPASFLDSDTAYRDFMEQLAQSSAAPVLADDLSLGPKNDDGTYSLYNSASFFKEDGSYGGRYDKIHLVPFGEYVPYKPLFFFTGHLLDGLPFIPGQRRVIFDDNGRKYGVFICYESIFGDEIRQFVNNGAQVLVNLSDDGWYGDTSAPWEHLDMVRMRAIENDRWVLRSTNTGVTASIDPYGRIVDQMPRHLRGALSANFNYIGNLTFYTRYGDWLAWLCASLTTLIVIVGLARSRRQPIAQ
ncbi:MAG TPA: apolipoprotein N-acyltransferase [Bryocella sp.]|nr:apolipoprotein N-acyltransferase [Bryocella sp.]